MRIICCSDGRMCRMTVAWCGCSDDWAVVDADVTPTPEDDGVFAHGFESEADAAAYMHDFDPKNPPAWSITFTDPADAPFKRGGRS